MKTILQEVKHRKMLKPVVSRSFRSFIEKYNPGEAWIINRSLEDKITVNNTGVKFIPYWKLP